MEFWCYLPQMRLSMEQLAERAQAAESAGFQGMAGMDHLAPPGAEGLAMYDAMIANAWLATQTQHLRVGSLVLCDAFRHPSVLAREAVSLDHLSQGRFELGLGWGSVESEFETFGVVPSMAKARMARLGESLEIITALWRGETVDYDGEHFTLRGARQAPGPLERIPIVIGGAGKGTMRLVATYADWWNVHIGILDRFDEMRPLAGDARCSLQIQVAFAADPARLEEVTATAQRRFGAGVVAGTGAQLIEHFASYAERGIERVYVWFSDFAPAETLASFGDEVIAHF